MSKRTVWRSVLSIGLLSAIITFDAVAQNASPPDGQKPAPSRPAWKQCPAGKRFGCETMSAGMPPPRGEEYPKVCGCLPRCRPPNPVLVSFSTDAHWPDGSIKGRFVCASAGLPSAPPRRGDTL